MNARHAGRPSTTPEPDSEAEQQVGEIKRNRNGDDYYEDGGAR